MSRPRGPEHSGLQRVHVRHRADRFSTRAERSEPRSEPPRSEPRPSEPPSEPRAEARFHEECYACPVGSAFATVRGSEPEALDHLLGALHEILQLARLVVDAADRAVEAQRSSRGGSRPRVRRIVVD